MENKEICDQVIEILNSIGITTNVTDMETDIDINELISDSIQWISFIISLVNIAPRLNTQAVSS